MAVRYMLGGPLNAPIRNIRSFSLCGHSPRPDPKNVVDLSSQAYHRHELLLWPIMQCKAALRPEVCALCTLSSQTAAEGLTSCSHCTLVSMPLSCNAVGDILALIKLAIDIATFVADFLDAPCECRALLQDLRSIERLLALAQPIIRAIEQEALQELVMDRLRIVSQRVQDGLELVAKFRSALDTSPIEPRSKWRATVVRWTTKTAERVVWALKRNMNAEACRVAIAQSFEPLVFALLLYATLFCKAIQANITIQRLQGGPRSTSCDYPAVAEAVG